MGERLAQLGEAMDRRDLLEVALLAVAIFVLLRLLGRARGSGVVRGLGLLAAGIFLVTQLVIVSLDLHELRKVLDYLLTTVVVGLIVIFQPELRRGLMVLGRIRGWRLFAPEGATIAERVAEAAASLSRDHVGALIAVQRELSLEAYAETGETLDARVSPLLLRTLFVPLGPLHDGAVVLRGDRVVAAGCQLPLAQPNADLPRVGMRHRAALGLSDETDAVLVVVSEETGRVSLAVGGKLEPVPREQLAERLGILLGRAA
ncbi:MAG TPA: diadenylate cyclase [Gemmataceae bacterium]|jgi:diadenylate cyclase|nr:diadenylate cyclase [Gemmataceae bacterium]